jgi:MFS family permease
MRRVGMTNKLHVALAGAGFEFAIVLGGILLGGYVDKTKEYKRVTVLCLILSVICLIPLGWRNDMLGPSPALVVLALLGLGFFAGPIQPINAELAVDVTYPGDETAVESVQQIGGNLISALLVPIAERAARQEYALLPSIPILANTVQGDVLLLVAVTLVTWLYFRGFQAPLRRSLADRRDDEMREDGVELADVEEERHGLLVV